MHDSGFLRWADCHVGGAVCAALSLPRAFRSRRDPDRVRDILIIELWELGASVMLHSSIEYLRKRFKGVRIHVLTSKVGRTMWELFVPTVNIYAIDGTHLGVFALSSLATIARLRKKRFDLVIDYELFLRIPAVLSGMLRARARAGFYRYSLEGLYRGGYLDYRCAYNQNMHVAKNFLALTKTAAEFRRDGVQYDGVIANEEVVVPKYRSRVMARDSFLRKLKAVVPGYEGKMILVSPDVGRDLSIRNYPVGSYVTVLRSLLRAYPEHTFVMIGTEEQRALADGLVRSLKNSRCVSLAGSTSLFEIMEALVLADLLLTNDQGPAHLASMTGTPTVVLMGPETPFVYGPIGNAVALYAHYHNSPVLLAWNHKNAKGATGSSVAAILPELVVRAVNACMDGTANYRTINNETPYLV